MKLNVMPGDVTTATVEMKRGDRLSVAFKDVFGEMQVINVHVQGVVGMVEHEQTGDALLIRRNKTVFVKG